MLRQPGDRTDAPRQYRTTIGGIQRRKDLETIYDHVALPLPVGKLVQLGRLDLDLEAVEVTRAIRGHHVRPIDLEAVRMSTRLDFAGNPADALIAATSACTMFPC